MEKNISLLLFCVWLVSQGQENFCEHVNFSLLHDHKESDNLAITRNFLFNVTHHTFGC